MMRRFFVRFAIIGVFLFLIIPAMGYQNEGYLYLSPVPSAEYVSPDTEFFLVRFTDIQPADVNNLSTFIEVTGASSGLHSGTTKVASDGRTVIFEVSSGFTQNELVTVSLNPTVAPGAGATVDPYSYEFMISSYMPGSAPAPVSIPEPQLGNDTGVVLAASDSTPAATGIAGLMPNGVSVPSNFPHINITTNDNPDDGYIFLDNRKSGSDSFNVIFDNTGSPIWYTQTDDERRDMKVQPNGILTMLARDGYMRFIGLDTNYNQVAEYRTVNGYDTDEHELFVLENGHYLLIGRRNNTVDMSRYVVGGQTTATVRETVIQEFTPEDDLIFQWRAWDNFDISDNVYIDSPTGSSIRFPHMNAIHIDSDGHVLLSCRNLSELSKINRDSGEFIWRLSGVNNQFSFIGDSFNGTSCQHAIRNVGPNRYLIFDNGNYHSPSLSRGVEYELDTTEMTATVVWEYRESPDWYAHYMGNTQRLPNGNTLINWVIGGQPKLTEIRPDGTKAFEMDWVNNSQAYRVWRCPWEGMALKPNLIIEPESDNITLLFNKFGDPNVAYYNIYGDTSPNPTQVLETSTTAMKRLTNLQNQQTYYFRVTAVDQYSGLESDFSEEESVYVDIDRPAGQNLVLNPDFSLGEDHWLWQVSGTAAAEWTIDSEVSHLAISTAGSQLQDIQMSQAQIRLYQEQEYFLAFDAWSALPRNIEVRVQQSQSPFTDYIQTAILPSLTPNHDHYEYYFTMQEASDPNARVVFNAGTSSHDVYIDNVVLLAVPTNRPDLTDNSVIDLDDLAALSLQWGRTDCLLENLCEGVDLDLSNSVDLGDLEWIALEWLTKLTQPYNGTPLEIPGIIEAEEFDLGGQNVAYYDTTDGNSGEQFRLNEDVDIENVTDTGGGYNVGYIKAGEWLEYTVNVTSGTYDIAVRVAAPSSAAHETLRVLLNDTEIASFDVPATQGWQDWVTLVVEDVVFSDGTNQILRLEFDGQQTGYQYNLNWIQIDEDLTGM